MHFVTKIFNLRDRLRGVSACNETPRYKALMPRAMVAILEDVLTWENPQLSIGFVIFVNIVFLILIQMSITFIELIFIMGMMMTSLDALEMWLRSKHRTSCLERLAQSDNVHLQHALANSQKWLSLRFKEFLSMREANPTKAFLLVNILLGAVFILGKTINGALLLYAVTMVLLLYPLVRPYIIRVIKKVQVTDSDGEIDSLMPEMSEQNMKELNFEAETVNTGQSVETWLPEGSPPGDLSDSDDSHSSDEPLVPLNVSKILDRDCTDSSEEEYLPQDEKDSLVSTVQVLPEATTWSGDAVTALRSLGGALGGLVARGSVDTRKRQKQRMSSTGSSDEFEFVDQSEL